MDHGGHAPLSATGTRSSAAPRPILALLDRYLVERRGDRLLGEVARTSVSSPRCQLAVLADQIRSDRARRRPAVGTPTLTSTTTGPR